MTSFSHPAALSQLDKVPMLVILDSNASNTFAGYIEEILDIEGFTLWSAIDLAQDELTTELLATATSVILADIAPSETVQQSLRSFVQRGGNLVALHPPREMADLFGLAPSRSIVNMAATDRYLKLEDAHPLARDPLAPALQFVGEADLYIPEHADTLAWIAGNREQATGFSAVCTYTAGRGKTAAFAYDLATCVVRLHQGNPVNASTGTNPDADGDGRWIPNDLFVGQLDPELKHLPQADIHQDLLVRILGWITSDSAPIPRFWYFPHAAPAVAYFNGDSDGMGREAYDTVVGLAEKYEAKFTIYLMEQHHALISPDDKADLERRGHGFGQHVILDMQTTVEEARQEVARSLAAYEAFYGERPLTNRGHCLVWPGWTEMVEFLSAGGVRLDQNFIPRRFLQHGYLNGSALPVKFMREDGRLLDVYEQNTHLTDDGSVEIDKFLIPAGTPDDVVATSLRLLDDCVNRFHGVFQASFHPQLTSMSVMWLLEALLEACRNAGIPTVNGDEWVAFNDGRRQSRIESIAVDDDAGCYVFEVSSSQTVQGLTIMLPYHARARTLERITLDDIDLSPGVTPVKGVDYGLTVTDLHANVPRRLIARYA
jgi:hypothetical protein